MVPAKTRSSMVCLDTKNWYLSANILFSRLVLQKIRTLCVNKRIMVALCRFNGIAGLRCMVSFASALSFIGLLIAVLDSIAF